MQTSYSAPTLDSAQRTVARRVVDALNTLVAATPGVDPTRDEVAKARREAGLGSKLFSILDRFPGLWGYEGGWHAALRRLRNAGDRGLLRYACNAPETSSVS